MVPHLTTAAALARRQSTQWQSLIPIGFSSSRYLNLPHKHPPESVFFASILSAARKEAPFTRKLELLFHRLSFHVLVPLLFNSLSLSIWLLIHSRASSSSYTLTSKKIKWAISLNAADGNAPGIPLAVT